jgi:hypothetical protein
MRGINKTEKVVICSVLNITNIGADYAYLEAGRNVRRFYDRNGRYPDRSIIDALSKLEEYQRSLEFQTKTIKCMVSDIRCEVLE